MTEQPTLMPVDADTVAYQRGQADNARQLATIRRGYLDWATDPALRRWAQETAVALDAVAVGEERWLAVLEARLTLQQTPAAPVVPTGADVAAQTGTPFVGDVLASVTDGPNTAAAPHGRRA